MLPRVGSFYCSKRRGSWKLGRKCTLGQKSADTLWAAPAVRVGSTMSVYVNNNVALQQMAEKNSGPTTFGQPSHFVQPSPTFGQPSHFVQPSPTFGQQHHGWPQHGILDRVQPMGLVMPPYTPILSTKHVLPTFASPLPNFTNDEFAALKRELLGELKADMNKWKPKEQQWPVVYDNRHAALTENALDPTEGLPTTVGSQLVNKIQLPRSVYTSVWLLPLIDSRLWTGEPEKNYSQLPLHLQKKYATPKLIEGNTSN